MYRESETLEKKSSFAAWKEIIISLCAFANKKGGKVVVGLDDQGNPLGLKIGKDTLEEMANKIKMHIEAQVKLKSMFIEGLVGIGNGDNPRIIESRLQGFIG